MVLDITLGVSEEDEGDGGDKSNSFIVFKLVGLVLRVVFLLVFSFFSNFEEGVEEEIEVKRDDVIFLVYMVEGRC